MKVEKNKYPLKLLEDFEGLISDLRKIQSENDHLITEEKGQVLDPESEDKKYEYLRFKYKDNKFDFIFTIDEFELTTNSNGEKISEYTCYQSPESENSTSHQSYQINRKNTVEFFNHWIDMIERYDKLTFTDPIVESYETEIYKVLKIFDDNADTEPFNVEQQIFLLKYLDNSQKLLKSKKGEYEVDDIIEEVEEFKKEVTRLPKNSSMMRISTILAKAKKQGIGLFKELMVMFKKNLMKKVLTEGYENVESILELLKEIS